MPPTGPEPGCVGRSDEPHRSHDADDGAEDVELPDVSGANRARNDASHERSSDTEKHSQRRPDALAPGQNKPREHSDDDSDDDQPEDLHVVRFPSDHRAQTEKRLARRH